MRLWASEPRVRVFYVFSVRVIGKLRLEQLMNLPQHLYMGRGPLGANLTINRRPGILIIETKILKHATAYLRTLNRACYSKLSEGFRNRFLISHIGVFDRDGYGTPTHGYQSQSNISPISLSHTPSRRTFILLDHAQLLPLCVVCS
jgi:hypothetical protein